MCVCVCVCMCVCCVCVVCVVCACALQNDKESDKNTFEVTQMVGSGRGLKANGRDGESA